MGFVCVCVCVCVCVYCYCFVVITCLWFCNPLIPLKSGVCCFPRDHGTATKAAMSIAMVHSQSQSASETMFNLESKWMQELVK